MMRDDQVQQILTMYYENNAQKLRRMADNILCRFGGISDKDYHDFYSIANEVFTDVMRKYNGEQPFHGFLYSCLLNKFKSEMTARNRLKRLSDRNTLSIDTPVGVERDISLGDLIPSDFDIEQFLIHRIDGDSDDRVELFLSSLNTLQRQIIRMKMAQIPVSEIKRRLGLSDSRYVNNMKSIKQSRAISMFRCGRRKGHLISETMFHRHSGRQYKESKEESMKKGNVENDFSVMNIDTTDSYRTDKCPLGSLLEDMAQGYIDRNYISQRQPFQWSDDKINKFYARILNNQPIPEIVICEKMEGTEKFSYLIDGLQRLTYAEEFRENRMPVKAKGVEFENIMYKKPVKDKEGNTKFELDTINIVGKYYKDLPQFLQKRFDNFNITVTRYFNCTSEMIDYHMRNYNNHVAMSKSQYGITNVSNRTSSHIKALSERHDFFKDIVSCNSRQRRNGTLDEIVAKSIMSMYFPEHWKKDPVDIFRYVDAHASDKEFEHLKDNLNRLAKVAGDSVKSLFSATNTHIWLAVYDKFLALDLPDDKFIAFMQYFGAYLTSDKAEQDAFITKIFKSRSTKDKKIVFGKITGLETMMYEFLHVGKEKPQETDVLKFVRENVNAGITEEDIDFYCDMLDGLTLEVNNRTKLLEKANRASLIALIGYACEQDIDLDEWFVEYFKNHTTYKQNQKENYISMVKDLRKSNHKKISA